MLLGWHCHLHRVQDRTYRLLLNIGGATIPELDEMAGGVVHAWRIAVAYLTLVPIRGRLAVHAVLVKQVAGVAGDVLAFGKPLVVIEHPAQDYLFLGDGIHLRGHDLGQRSEHLQLRRLGTNRGRLFGATASAPD